MNLLQKKLVIFFCASIAQTGLVGNVTQIPSAETSSLCQFLTTLRPLREINPESFHALYKFFLHNTDSSLHKLRHIFFKTFWYKSEEIALQYQKIKNAAQLFEKARKEINPTDSYLKTIPTILNSKVWNAERALHKEAQEFSTMFYSLCHKIHIYKMYIDLTFALLPAEKQKEYVLLKTQSKIIADCISSRVSPSFSLSFLSRVLPFLSHNKKQKLLKELEEKLNKNNVSFLPLLKEIMS